MDSGKMLAELRTERENLEQAIPSAAARKLHPTNGHLPRA